MGPGPGARRASVAVAGCLLVAACSSASTPSSSSSAAASSSGPGGYYVYWDQNEEVDYLAMPSGQTGRLVPPWDANGQLCVVPDGSGRFTTGYNPTLPDQHNPGGVKPYMQPPVGEALWSRDGRFSGQTAAVPGPYQLPGQTRGGDVPPDAAAGDAYNNNGTYTGCAFDSRADLFATDLGTAQGAFPPPDDGRLVEWFAPAYTSACVLLGPTAGGVGPHHVDGTGGLRQPSLLSVDGNGDVLLPEAGTGRVLRVDHASLPAGPAQCGADGLAPPGSVHTSVFLDAHMSKLGFPLAIVRDPSCACWAADSVFGDPAIAWFDDQGRPLPDRGVVHGTPLGDPHGYSPFGLAFGPDGSLYFVDIHITCPNNQISNCGPTDYAGRLMRVTFSGGRPSTPVSVAGGFDFPINVTICVPAHQACPFPTGAITAPGSGPSENGAPATGPPTTAPATAEAVP